MNASNERHDSDGEAADAPRDAVPEGARSGGVATVTESLQTDDLPSGYMVMRGAMTRFPLVMSLWCPVSVLLSGISYNVHWRSKWLSSVEHSRNESTPRVLLALAALLFIGLLASSVVTVQLLVRCCIKHVSHSLDRKGLILVALFHGALVAVPLGTCEMYLVWNPIEGVDDGVKGLATATAYIQIVTGVMFLWWVYVSYVVDKIHQRVRKVADEFIAANHFGLRRPGVYVPTMARYTREQPQEEVYAFRSPSQGNGNNNNSNPGVTPTRTALISDANRGLFSPVAYR